MQNDANQNQAQPGRIAMNPDWTPLDPLLDLIRTALKVAALDVLLYDENSGRLMFVAGLGFEQDVRIHMTVCPGEGAAGRAFKERAVLHFSTLEGANGEPSSRQRVLAGGKILSGFCAPMIMHDRVVGVLEVFLRRPARKSTAWLNLLEAFARQVAGDVAAVETIARLQQLDHKLGEALDAAIAMLADALDLRDGDMEGHTPRVAEMTVRFARQLGLSEAELVNLRQGAYLHDIGKLRVPEDILRKKGPLGDEEWQVMRLHPVTAHEMLCAVDALRSLLDIPYCHHERWDGSGYPRGLQGEQIPLAARIFAVVDTWDALRTDRPYRSAWTHRAVLEYIRAQSRRQFDPNIVDAFLEWMAVNL